VEELRQDYTGEAGIASLPDCIYSTWWPQCRLCKFSVKKQCSGMTSGFCHKADEKSTVINVRLVYMHLRLTHEWHFKRFLKKGGSEN